MKRICRELQERLAVEGAQALREDEAAQRHLEGCDACFQALEGLARLDEALSAMSMVDAPEPIVSRLLERVAAEPVAEAKSEAGERGLVSALSRWPRARRPVFWGLASAASIAFLALLMVPTLHRSRRVASASLVVRDQRPASAEHGDAPVDSVAAPKTATSDDVTLLRHHSNDALTRNVPKDLEQFKTLGYVGSPEEMAADRKRQVAPPASAPVKEPVETKRVVNELEKAEGDRVGKKEDRYFEARADNRAEIDGVSAVDGGVVCGVVGGVVGGLPDAPVEGRAVRVGGNIKPPRLIKRVEALAPAGARTDMATRAVILELVVSAQGRVVDARVLRSVPGLDEAAVAAVRQWVYAPTVVDGVAVPVILTVTVHVRAAASDKPASSVSPSTDPAIAFLQERATSAHVEFQEATGYWRNTYLPGDARVRLMQARLASWDRSTLSMPPHDGAAPPSQPFDAPRNAALAVYVHADRSGLEGPQRMLVQVGLQGAARVGGARPAMNVAVVLDLRGEVASDVAAAMRALAVAFSQARQAGDRFHLIVAGRPGGVAVAPEAFKHGPVTVALDRLLAGETVGDSLDLAAATAAAFQAVCHGGDADAPFGTSSVVLVTGQSLGAAAGVLTDFAHQGAVAGVSLSAVGVGQDAPLSELDTLAFAGHGRRRVLEDRSKAARLVDDELYAASSAVARAVRLRIRLAPGVRLVGVIGSQRLDEIQAERVREAERSLDLQLARHMGIEADRGDDEDGIQIVIPTFQANDAHAILLDVVAPGPGAVADVSVRYKDVAFLRNGVSRASLALPAGRRAAGPLERNVLKNLLAFRLAGALERAGNAAALGDVGGAAAQLEEARILLGGLRLQVAGLGSDADIARDMAMLETYVRLLGNAALAPAQRAMVADSLRYAGRLKLLRRQA